MKGVYLLDKLVVWMRVDVNCISRLRKHFEIGVSNTYGVMSNTFLGRKPGFCQLNYNMDLPSGESYFFGIGQYAKAPNDYWEDVKVEFNPAKVGMCEEFTRFYDELLAHAKYIDFKRFDVAIDYPKPREAFFVLKDQRKVDDRYNSVSDRTTYLGRRSQHGNVKLYNKQLESKLVLPKTRLEFTLDYANSRYEEFARLWPDVYCVTGDPPDDIQGVDRVLVMAVMEHPDYIMHLTHYKRKKIEQLLATAALKLAPDELSYKIILQQILEYGKGINYLNFAEIDEELEEFAGETAIEPLTGIQEQMKGRF